MAQFDAVAIGNGELATIRSDDGEREVLLVHLLNPRSGGGSAPPPPSTECCVPIISFEGISPPAATPGSPGLFVGNAGYIYYRDPDGNVQALHPGPPMVNVGLEVSPENFLCDPALGDAVFTNGSWTFFNPSATRSMLVMITVDCVSMYLYAVPGNDWEIGFTALYALDTIPSGNLALNRKLAKITNPATVGLEPRMEMNRDGTVYSFRITLLPDQQLDVDWSLALARFAFTDDALNAIQGTGLRFYIEGVTL